MVGINALQNILTIRLINAPVRTMAVAEPADQDTPPMAGVSLSIEARTLDALLQDQPDSLSWREAFDTTGRLHQQIASDGSAAELLAVMPDSNDPARLALARQAANRLSQRYGLAPLYPGVEPANPLQSLSRESLSKIAYNDSAAFTPAERDLALTEIGQRDDRYWKAVQKQQEALELLQQDASVRALRDKAWLQLYAGMSDVEKRAHYESAELLRYKLVQAMHDGVEVPDVPAYANLSDAPGTLLAAATDEQGRVTWKRISLRQLAADDIYLELLDFVAPRTADGQRGEDAQALKSRQWLSLYASVNSYAD
ncbi:hypothetical protein [Pseudomonas panipatensis]|uniref:Uncharacterized protein n=2 Tax=Pseudomonas panipatensis TaxID=428992 RepID=A0A1G8G8F0_9PSED|nr:hypothetical protein [Pseudomonas panipatensis]SDH90674.1 hypothetical protein SAMN05216272_10476 [Pseudomonas panipatensis]SMP44837.1 hypothetical protein SAMN06295951_101908 [Pseudomonas panipatensis]